MMRSLRGVCMVSGLASLVALGACETTPPSQPLPPPTPIYDDPRPVAASGSGTDVVAARRALEGAAAASALPAPAKEKLALTVAALRADGVLLEAKRAELPQAPAEIVRALEGLVAMTYELEGAVQAGRPAAEVVRQAAALDDASAAASGALAAWISSRGRGASSSPGCAALEKPARALEAALRQAAEVSRVLDWKRPGGELVAIPPALLLADAPPAAPPALAKAVRENKRLDARARAVVAERVPAVAAAVPGLDPARSVELAAATAGLSKPAFEEATRRLASQLAKARESARAPIAEKDLLRLSLGGAKRHVVDLARAVRETGELPAAPTAAASADARAVDKLARDVVGLAAGCMVSGDAGAYAPARRSYLMASTYLVGTEVDCNPGVPPTCPDPTYSCDDATGTKCVELCGPSVGKCKVGEFCDGTACRPLGSGRACVDGTCATTPGLSCDAHCQGIDTGYTTYPPDYAGTPFCDVALNQCVNVGWSCRKATHCPPGTECHVALGHCVDRQRFECNATDPTKLCRPGEACAGVPARCDMSNPREGTACTAQFDPLTGQEIKGECRAGTWTSRGGVLRCEGKAPSPETCNGLDDDCNGVADDLADSAPELQGTCVAPGPDNDCTKNGRYLCVGGRRVCLPGSPKPEVCDGRDNDCDGAVDDLGATQPGHGEACVAAGPDNDCNAHGVMLCKNGKVDCYPGAPRPELCDRRDNNCNGQTDEGNVCGPKCPRPTRACTVRGCTGIQRCKDGVWGKCEVDSECACAPPRVWCACREIDLCTTPVICAKLCRDRPPFPRPGPI